MNSHNTGIVLSAAPTPASQASEVRGLGEAVGPHAPPPSLHPPPSSKSFPAMEAEGDGPRQQRRPIGLWSSAPCADPHQSPKRSGEKNKPDDRKEKYFFSAPTVYSNKTVGGM